MPAIRIQESASHRLDDIYRYTRDRWGESQAEKYITDLFAAFDRIATHVSCQDRSLLNLAWKVSSFGTSVTSSTGATSRMGTSGS